ncbi:MAG: type IV pilin protein [Methylococcales bacterium]
MKTKIRGFTLIELLIAVAILGIIAAIAVPSYSENIKQSKRKEAQAALVSFANAMEMWKMQNNNSYLGAGPSGAATGAPTVFSTVVPVSGGTVTYNLTISAAAATTYTVSAAPVSTDSKCGTLTLTNTGVTSPTTAGCW